MFNKKKNHFSKLLKDATVLLWELEFSYVNLLREREIVRIQYDQACQAENNLKDRIKAEPKNKEHKDTLLSVESKKEQLKSHLDIFDIQIEGTPVSEQFPQGHEGVLPKLEKTKDRVNAIKEYIKSI